MMRLLVLVLLFSQTSAFAAEIRPVQTVMKNGLTVFTIERHSLPIVSLVVLIRSGATHDPPGRVGVASLTASLLDEGTTRRTSTEIAEEIEFVGGSLSASAGQDYTTVSVRVLKKDMEKGMDLLSDVLLHPRFDSGEVDRVKQLVLGSIHAEKDDPMTLAKRAFDRLIFGNHPYRNPVIGSSETVRSLDPEALREFHQRYYLPNNALIAIVGDVTEEEVMSLVDRYFSGWASQPFERDAIPAPVLQMKKEEKIEKRLTQTSVLMGHVGIARKNPDFYPVIVMNYILGGGGFSSRLLSEIRDNQGLVYSVGSSFDARLHPGSFSISFQTRSNNTQAAISAVHREIDRIRKEGVSETELSEAKAYLMGSFPLRLETTNGLAGILSSVGFHELGVTYFDDYTRAIQAVTREDILRVARQYLHPSRMALVVVGNLAEAAKP
jgi:zinc protease